MKQKLTQQDMARLLDIDARTLRNWRVSKPFLYKIIIQGFAVEDVKNTLESQIDKLAEVVENNNPSHSRI